MRLRGVALEPYIWVVTAMALWLFGPAQAAHAANWYVDDDCDPPTDGSPEDPFCTIEDGISAASDHDTVWVRPGTYNVADGLLDFGIKKIALRSTDGPGEPNAPVTTIGGGVYIHREQGEETLVEGFTITNPNPQGNGVKCLI